MRSLRMLAFRNLRVRPARTLLTLVGIVLGVAVIVSVSVANRSIYAGFEALFADVAGAAHLTVEPASRNEDGFDQRILEWVRRVDGVRLAVPITSADTMLILEDVEVAVKTFGVDPALDRSVRPYQIVSGSFLPPGDRYNAVVVEDLAARYGIDVGDGITLLGAEGAPSEQRLPISNEPEELTVVGIMAKEGPARQAQVVMPIRASQAIFSRGRNIDAIDVVAQDRIARSVAGIDRLKAALQDQVGTSCEVIYPAARAQTIAEALEGISMGLSFFAVTALFGGAYLVFNTFSMTVVERMREIGMLRAVGATRGQNVRLILTEALFLGLAGSLLGLIFGLVLSLAMTRMLGAPFGLTEWTLSVPPGGVLAGFITGMTVTLFSALIPAIRAGRISPIEALSVRGREGKAGWLIRHGWKVGLAMVVFSEAISVVPVSGTAMEMAVGQVSFFFLLTGVTLLVPRITRFLERLAGPAIAALYGNEGRIGGGNVNRALGRTTVTVGALTMGVLMLIVMGSQWASMTSDVQEWMDAALQGDLFVTSFSPMRLDLGRELETIQGVNLVAPMRYQVVKAVGAITGDGFVARDEEMAFVAVKPLEHTRISRFEFASGQGDEQACVERLLEGGAVFVSTTISERYGLQKGDAIRLRSARGERDFAVAGVIVDYTWGGSAVTGSWRDLERFFRTDRADVFVIDVAPEVSEADVRQRIEAQYGRRRHIEVSSGQEYRDKWLEDFTSLNALFSVIVVISIVIAALGVTNTMTMNVLERIREIGCLRAVGMTRWQVVRMVLAEALIIGILGGLLGLAFGGYVSIFAVQGMAESTGWDLAYVMPTRLLFVGLAIALGVSQLASLYPAWRAARINIVKAVQYE